MKACIVRFPPVEAQSRVLAGCAYKRGRSVNLGPPLLERPWNQLSCSSLPVLISETECSDGLCRGPVKWIATSRAFALRVQVADRHRAASTAELCCLAVLPIATA